VLELPEPVGLEGFLGAPGCVLPGSELREVPLAPDELELPVAELPPPEAESPRSQPAIRVPLRANATAAANAVDFMLTSIGCVPGREQGMDREKTFTKVVLFTDDEGRARFREERVPLTEGTPQARLSALLPSGGYQLRESPVGFASEFHCTPQPQWVFILRGEMQIGLQDGSVRRFGPGQHFFAADLLPQGARFDARLHGHRSAQRGAEPLVTLFLRA
jgi:hypothetical protein